VSKERTVRILTVVGPVVSVVILILKYPIYLMLAFIGRVDIILKDE
jgi:hypothetical protein